MYLVETSCTNNQQQRSCYNSCHLFLSVQLSDTSTGYPCLIFNIVSSKLSAKKCKTCDRFQAQLTFTMGPQFESQFEIHGEQLPQTPLMASTAWHCTGCFEAFWFCWQCSSNNLSHWLYDMNESACDLNTYCMDFNINTTIWWLYYNRIIFTTTVIMVGTLGLGLVEAVLLCGHCLWHAYNITRYRDRQTDRPKSRWLATNFYRVHQVQLRFKLSFRFAISTCSRRAAQLSTGVETSSRHPPALYLPRDNSPPPSPTLPSPKWIPGKI